MIQKKLLVSAISLVLLSACSESSSTADPSDLEPPVNEPPIDQPPTDSSGTTNPVLGERKLLELDNSEAFFTALREGLVRQNTFSNGGFIDGGFDEITDGVTSDNVDAGALGTVDFVPIEESAGDSAVASSSAPNVGAAPADVTTTNVQEVGVDEQDRMKSDGEFLYILDNQFDFGIPLPADAPLQPAFSSIALPTDSIATVRILSLQPDAPDATPITDIEVDIGGGFADGMYLYKTDGKQSLVLTGSSFTNYLEAWNDSFAFSQTRSVITKLDVTEPTQSAVESTVQIDGQIISSRRIGNNLFLATRFYPTVPGIEPFSLTPEEYENALQNADLLEALPKIQNTDGSITELVNPAGCFVATAPQNNDYYYTPDIVSLAVIDLETLQLQDSECFLGASETLYATPNSIFLATTRWDYSNFPILDLQDTVTTTAFVDPRIDTDIHQFSINGSQLSYSGSGVVSGHLGWNPLRKPFRMSEKDGYLRVATFAEQQNQSVSPINVSVLKLEGDGELENVAQLPNENNPEHIGKPGEQLYASRFLGDRGYLVTFRQTDPLYVVDFSNPEDPKLAGELEIDGYSDYLQPIGEDYLLGIGKDAAPASDGIGDGFGALEQGIKLSLFNVSDANNPTEVQSLVIGERGSQAAALTNHRAITIQRATDTHPTRIAFGIDVAGLADPRPIEDPFTWFPWNFTGLHGFDINVGDNAGIEKRGVMVVNSASNPNGFSGGFYGDDRSVIVNDSVFYVHGSDVFSANWTDLSNFTGPR